MTMTMWTKAISILALPTLLAGTAAPGPAQAAPEPPALAGAAFATPDAALGDKWQKSSDAAVVGVGDLQGFHLYVARESAAFRWSPLATLRAPGTDLGAWTGEVCVTGSGRYAVAVYAPAIATNRPAVTNAGAIASVVDLATGAARTVATGVKLAYFNPACGPADRVLLTRAIGIDGQETDLIAANAATGKVESTRRVKAQFTTPAPAPDGDYGIAGGKLVKVGPTGGLTILATPAGQAFGVAATAAGAVDLVSVHGSDAVAQRWQAGRLTETGTGPWDRLQLFRGPGGNRLVGEVAGVRAGIPGLATLRADRQVPAVSAQGHLIVERASARPGGFEMTTRATHSGRSVTGSVGSGGGPAHSSPLPGTPAPKAGPVTALADTTTPTCAVARNEPTVQPFQPSPNMVEWAVDRAVHNRLTVTRPDNYLKTQLPAYTPQGTNTFPMAGIQYGDHVPAQLMLAILAQETNMAQASWHGVPGDSANPLISDYYGNRAEPWNGSSEYIDYTQADCGYGIGQVTTGMRVGQTVYTRAQQQMIAVDYAANIAAALNILIAKWNQLNTDSGGRNWLNDGNPRYIENWFLAVWAYNSGFYPYADRGLHNGRWGVGWFNNPANPDYPANRLPFLRYDKGTDASTPSHWSYPERIMGWAETPQWYWRFGFSFDKYAKPNWGTGTPLPGQITLPGRLRFCSTDVNNCDPSVPANPCPAKSDACWWHGRTTFADCSTQCATESLAYGLDSVEPGVERIYDRDCGDFTGSDDEYKAGSPLMVYTLNYTSQYNLGCSIGVSDGKFTLRLGSPAGGESSKYANVDLHQLGAGHKGHMWFTHVYQPDTLPPFPHEGTSAKHQVFATWSPDIPYERRYDIVAHLPSHGGEWDDARYRVYADPGTDVSVHCLLDQTTADFPGENGEDEWVYLGNFNLNKGARVQLNNVDVNGRGNVDIAFDAMAFIPIAGAGHGCDDEY